MTGSNDALPSPRNPGLESEAWLPSELDHVKQLRASKGFGEHATCLITGATGFIGLELILCLIQRTQVQLECLVRGAELSEAEARLFDLLEARGTPRALIRTRVHVIVGDLSLPNLGLSPDTWESLSRNLDAIFHVGGWINFVYPYEKLRPANVDGTREILRLAALGRGIPVHFVSSLAVFFGPEREGGPVLLESEAPSQYTGLKGGYRQSKWVADRLVQKAMLQGLPATLIRPVRVTGHSRTGMLADPNDLLFSLIRGCVRLGFHPRLNIQIPMVPVDFVAEVLVTLAQNPDALGRAFHLIGAGDVGWEELWSLIHAFGYRTESIPEPEWRALLDARAKGGPDRKDMVILKALLASPNNLFFTRPALDDTQLQGALHGTGIVCPPISNELIGTYLRHLIGSGWLPPPLEIQDITVST